MIQKADSLQISTSKVDTLFIDQGFAKYQDAYINLLEKTNEQFSIWSNPFMFIVAVLAILFTVLTIVAAFVIYGQHKEYKQEFEKQNEEYKEQSKKNLKDFSALLEASQNQVNKLKIDLENSYDKMRSDLSSDFLSISKRVAEIKSELERKSNGEEDLKRIEKLEKELSDLKSKSSLISTLGSISGRSNVSAKLTEGVSLSGNPVIEIQKIHTCSECKTDFPYKSTYPSPILSIGVKNTLVECPNCGNTEFI